MRALGLAAFLLAFSLLALPVSAQQTTSTSTSPAARDPQALQILMQSVNVVGGLPAISAIQDYTAAGNITYYWAGDQVQGPVTIQGKGLTGFRMDANLPAGVQTLAISGISGRLETPDGTVKHLSPYNLANMGSLTFPVVRIAAALANTSVGVSLVGSVQTDGHRAYQVRAVFPVDPILTGDSSIPGLGTLDFFVDSTSFQLLKFAENVGDERNTQVTYIHEVIFGNYQTVGGVSVPYSVAEKISGQQTWSLALQSVSFNSGLTDSTFVVN